MHRDPFSHNLPRRVEPSDRAKAAQARWLERQGGEENARRRLVAPHTPSAAYLDEWVAKWQEAMLTRGAGRLRDAIQQERLRRLRRARRLLRLAMVLLSAEILAAVAVIVWFGILGNH